MSRGKVAKTDRPVEWKLTIPTSIAVQINKHLEDPMTMKPIFGARGKLTAKLYLEYLRKVEFQIPTDHMVAKTIQAAKTYDMGSDRVVDKLLQLLSALGYEKCVETYRELYSFPEYKPSTPSDPAP